MRGFLKMLFEYAIIPNVLSYESNEYENSLVQELFAQIMENGVLINLNSGKWVDFINNERIPQNRREMLGRLFKKLKDRNRIIISPPVKEKVVDDNEWVALAVEANQLRKIDAIVIQNNTGVRVEHKNFLFFPFDRENQDLWEEISGKRQSKVYKCEDSYQNHLIPILRYARTLTLIDPFFDCLNERKLSVLKIIAKNLGDFRDIRVFGSIKIQVSYHKINQRRRGGLKEQDEKERLREHIMPLVEEFGHSIYVKYLNMARNVPPHNRYILTDQCGLLAGDSFECFPYDSAREDDWTLMDEIRREEVYKEFCGADPKYSTKFDFEFSKITPDWY